MSSLTGAPQVMMGVSMMVIWVSEAVGVMVGVFEVYQVHQITDLMSM